MGARHGSIDGYAAAVGRWLVTRDGFDLLVYYLPDYDFASHAAGPDAAYEALARERRCDRRAPRRGRRARRVPRALRGRPLLRPRADARRPGRLGCRPRSRPSTTSSSPRRTAPGWSTASGAHAPASSPSGSTGRPASRRALPRGRRASSRGATAPRGSTLLATYPGTGSPRASAALRNPNAGDVLVSAAPGFEFADLAGRHHAGGGSHGSLVAATRRCRC